MTEKELIKKITQLRRIKPKKNWVFLTKSQILRESISGKETSFFSKIQQFFSLKPAKLALAGFCIVLFISGLFEISRNSLPGEWLYPVKKIAEKGEAVFVFGKNKPGLDLEYASRRLDELEKIAQTNQVKKLTPALEEYKQSLANATKNLNKMDATTSSDPVIIKELAKKTQQLEESREKLEKTYGIVGLDDNQELSPTKTVVELLIKDLEKRSLTEAQTFLFEEAKNDYDNGFYNQALEKLINLSYPQG